jgi:hypothetical protein
MATTADTLKLAAGMQPSNGSTILSDPLLHMIETPIQKALSWAHNLFSHPPVVTSNVSDIQNNMQNKGYGVDASNAPLPKGSWTAQWSSELRRLANDQFNVPGFGNVSAMKVISPLLGEANLAKTTPQILNWIGSIGKDGRQILTNLGAEVGNYTTLQNLKDMVNVHITPEEEAAFHAREAGRSVAIENFLGGHKTAADFTPSEINHQAIQDIGNMLTLYTIIDGAGAISGGLKKVTGGMIAGSLPEDATAGEKVAALTKKLVTSPQSMITRSLPEEFGATPRFGFVKFLYNAAPDAAKGAEGSGLLNFLNGVPGARNLLPLIAKMPTEESKYAILKNTIASFSRIPAKQVASLVASKGFSTGVKALAVSEGVSKLTGNDHQIYDLAHQAPYSGMLGEALNGLSMAAGTHYTAAEANSVHAGKLIENALAPIKDNLATVGVGDAFKQATGISVKEMTERLGQTEATNIYNEYLNKAAAYHYAEQNVMKDVQAGKFEGGSEQAIQAGQKYAEDAYADPAIAAFARQSLIAQPNEMITHFMKENFDYLDKKATGEVVPEFKTGKAGKEKWFAARQKIAVLRPELDTVYKDNNKRWFFGSKAETKSEDLRSERLSVDMNKNATFDKSGKTPRLYHMNKNVNDHGPATWQLNQSTPYGEGIPSTDNTGWVGRVKKNVYNLQHVSPDGNPAHFLDLTQANGGSRPVSDAIKNLIGSNMGRSSDANKYLNELGVMEPGNTPDALRYLKKDAIPGKVSKGYEALRAALNDDYKYTGQQVLDLYRRALESAGVLNKQQVDQRIKQVTNSIIGDPSYSGFKYSDKNSNLIHVVKPEATTAVKVRVDPALSKDNFMPGSIMHNNVVGRGQLGWVNPEYLTQQDIQNSIRKWASKYAKLGHEDEVNNMFSTLEMEARNGQPTEVAPRAVAPMPTGGKEHAIWSQAQSMAEKLGINPRTVSLMDDPIKLMYGLWKRSQAQASEATLLEEAPLEVHQAVDRIKNDLGWRPALGTGIGHAYEQSVIPQHIVESNNNMAKSALRQIGFSTDAVKDENTFEIRRAQRAAAIDEYLLKTGTKLPYNMTGRDVINLLAQGAAERGSEVGRVGHLFQQMATLPKEAFSLIYKRATPTIDKLFNEDPSNSDLLMSRNRSEIAKARAEYRAKAELAKNAETTVNDLNTKTMRSILMQPVNPNSKLGYEAPLMDARTANNLITQILAADAKMKSTYVGLGKVDDLLRASTAGIAKGAMSFMGSAPLKAGENPDKWKLYDITAGLGQNAIAIRDKFRFALNPLFGIRRMVKTNLKAALEGIPATANPYLSLMRTNRLESAYELAKRVIPAEFGKSMDGFKELDSTIGKSDIFNFFNPLHNMMWQAQHLKENGLTDTEIAQKLEKINGYGDRTAFEKSIATVFYPFSFNKTLYRNIGGYVLDHVGQAAILNQALQVYQHGVTVDGHKFAFNQNNDIGKWLDQHFPLITELKQLNALDHGVGLGQFGGMNANYINTVLNMFAPQAITLDNSSQAAKLLKSLIPAWNELNTLLIGGYNPETGKYDVRQGTLENTVQAGLLETLNLGQHFANIINENFGGAPRRGLNYTNTTGDLAQVQQGLDFVNLAKSYLAPAIQRKMTWTQALPAGTYIPDVIANQKVSSASIEQYASILYPAYSGSGLSAAYGAKQDALKTLLNKMNQSNDWNYSNYKSFFDQAVVVENKLTRDKDPNAIANLTQQMRDKAVAIAMGTPSLPDYKGDKRFLAFYKKYYQSTFGPIEEAK